MESQDTSPCQPESLAIGVPRRRDKTDGHGQGMAAGTPCLWASKKGALFIWLRIWNRFQVYATSTVINKT